MSRFWDDAVQVLETACRAPRDGIAADLAVILDPSGGLRIVPADGWSAEGLRSEYGGTIYHVTRTGSQVRVEGRTAGMSCTLRGPLLSAMPHHEAAYTKRPKPAPIIAPLATRPLLSTCEA